MNAEAFSRQQGCSVLTRNGGKRCLITELRASLIGAIAFTFRRNSLADVSRMMNPTAKPAVFKWRCSRRLTSNPSLLRCWIVLSLILHFTDSCSGLVCWHCLTDNCDQNPEENVQAKRQSCLNGQTCQKVVFEMQSDVDDTKYKSTVRSCSGDCIPQDDYENCTNDLYTTRGCVKRACCSDDDLCNSQTSSLLQRKPTLFCPFCIVAMMVILRMTLMDYL